MYFFKQAAKVIKSDGRSFLLQINKLTEIVLKLLTLQKNGLIRVGLITEFDCIHLTVS